MWSQTVSVVDIFNELFWAHSGYIVDETFSFMMSLSTMSLGLRFCMSRKGGTGGDGWVHPKGANSMVMSGLISRNDLVGIRRAISVLFGINGIQGLFFSYSRLAFLERLN